MKRPYICAVIGKNFGDEGKGLAVDYLTLQAKGEPVLVIRHNGGAQSGHTVDLPDKRFVFHELSSGSFRGADTFWADTFYPDMYKLREEAEVFREISGFMPGIFAHPQAQITLIDDVLLNMAAEESRGDARHGSCGMGIYEAQCRGKAGFGITIRELFAMDETELIGRMQEIRKEYLPKRLEELRLTTENLGEYGELLRNEEILENYASEIMQNLSHVQLVENVKAFLSGYTRVIFENGQGLGLDQNVDNEWHTTSNTGLKNPYELLKSYDNFSAEVCYVTRSYLTRHGEGPLEEPCSLGTISRIATVDQTNHFNDFQGGLRYGILQKDEMLKRIDSDFKLVENNSAFKRTIAKTHFDYDAPDDFTFHYYSNNKFKVFKV